MFLAEFDSCFKLIKFSSALIFRFFSVSELLLIYTAYVMRMFVLWDLVSSAKWLSQKVTEWLGLHCLRVLFKIQLNHLRTFNFR